MSSAIRCFLLFCLATVLNAQSAHQEPRFALELHYGEGMQPSYRLVQRGQHIAQNSFFFGPVLVPLSERDAVPSTQQRPCALKLDYKDDGDSVSIVASLFFGVCDTEDSRQLAHNHPEQPLGKYSARLDESVVLEEMKQFGLQPYTIRVVSAQIPHPVGPPTFSNVPSLQIEMVGEDRQFYKLLLHNVSSRAVTGFVVARSYANGRSVVTGYDEQKSLIAPGADRELQIHSNNARCVSPDSSVSDADRCPIVLEGAIFADGSYSGDPVAVATMEAGQLAAKSERERLLGLIQDTLADSTLSDAAKIGLLRSEVLKLPEESGQSVIDQIRWRYSNLPDAGWLDVKASISNSVQMQQEMVLQTLKEFVDSSTESSSPESLAQWLNQRGLSNQNGSKPSAIPH
jgi:hypothetical protein